MTGQERDELLQLLREFSRSREPIDPVACELVTQAVAQNPKLACQLVQQVMGLRLALQAKAQTGAAAVVQPPPELSWGGGLLKVAAVAGLGVAAGSVLAEQASSWLSLDELDLGE